MTPETFRELALELPEVIEWKHHGKPDFRVGGRIFATLGYPDADWGMVSLRPSEQLVLLRDASAGFRPSAGRWGESGSTQVCLVEVDTATLRLALLLAWKGRAGKRLLKRYGEQLALQTS